MRKLVLGFDQVGSVGFGPALVALKLQKILVTLGTTGTIGLVFFLNADVHFLPSVLNVNETHGLTAMCLVLLALAVMGRRGFRKPTHMRDIAFALIASLAVLRIYEAIFWHSLLFSSGVEALFGLTSDQHIPMGLNTAVSLFLLSTGAFMRHRLPSLSIVMILSGLVFPSVSALGFSYQHQGLYGQMSLVTTLLLLTLGASELLLFVRSPLLKHFLTTSSWGRMARLQLLIVICGAWLIGILAIRSDFDGAAEAVVGGVIWLFLVTMLITGPLFERVDRDRRALERELTRKANIDPLTGLWNRRAVREMQFLGTSTDDTGRVPKADHIGVIMADVDMFKRINDVAGHCEGDKVLRNIARVLRERVRGLDVVARWGGEEFLILLPDLTHEKAMEVAQVLRVAVASTVTWSNNGQPESVTLSIGVTAMNEKAGKTLEIALKDADHALYAAKSCGRNRVVMYEDTPHRVSKNMPRGLLLNHSVH
ncbi:GGDEF domain-containing protein [Pacificibacter marinus]|nr:GGDEF domain-containing protein [Pacificibacter marinus]